MQKKQKTNKQKQINEESIENATNEIIIQKYGYEFFKAIKSVRNPHTQKKIWYMRNKKKLQQIQKNNIPQ